MSSLHTVLAADAAINTAAAASLIIYRERAQQLTDLQAVSRVALSGFCGSYAMANLGVVRRTSRSAVVTLAVTDLLFGIWATGRARRAWQRARGRQTAGQQVAGWLVVAATAWTFGVAKLSCPSGTRGLR